MQRFIVMTATAQMPASVKARYRRIAIVQLSEGFEGVPKMISARAKGIERLLFVWEGEHLGNGGPNTAAEIARRVATRVVARLNNSLAVMALDASDSDLVVYVRQLIAEDKGD